MLNRDDPRSLAMRIPGRTMRDVRRRRAGDRRRMGARRACDARRPWLARGGGAARADVASLSLVGRHNALNALAALALASTIARIDRDVLDALKRVRGPAASDAADRRGGRRRLHRRLEGHDRRRDAGRARRHRAPGRADRRRRRQGPGLRAAQGGGRRALPRRAADRPRCAARSRARSRARLRASRMRRHARRRGRRARSRSPSPATPCCCRRHARASTSSRTTSSAASASRRACSARLAEDRAACVRTLSRRRRRSRPFGVLDQVVRHRSARCRATPRTMLAPTTRRSRGRRCCCSRSALVMVYSASIAMAEASAHTGYRAWYFLARHAMFVAVGLLAATVAFQVPMKAWQQLAPWLFIAGAVLLVLVLVPGIGKSVNGSRRWLSLAVDQRAAVRIHEARGRAVRGELRGAQGGVPARRAAVEADAGPRLPAAVRRDGRDRRRCCCSSRTSARSS